MLLLLSFLACGDKTTDTADVQETSTEPSDTDTEETETQPEAFVPLAGHWTYSGGQLIESGTTCQLDPTTEGELTDPVGFTLTNTDAGFVIVADDATDNGVNCKMTNPASSDAGSFSCDDATTEVVFEDVDMVIVRADIEMSIETATIGSFSDEATLSNTFSLTLNCLNVTHDFGGSCDEISEFFPTPCTIQFTANATLDQ